MSPALPPGATVLVDAPIFVFRAWHAIPETRTDPAGRPINAFLGFADFVADLLRAPAPTRLAFAFDTSLGSGFRQAIYPPYKANRPPAPDSLRWQFARCRALLDRLGLPQLASDSHEADDLIGTLAARARRAGRPVVLLTADKDLAQLLGPDDLWWDCQRQRRLDARGVARAFGVPPAQIADQLALAGDKVDNIPGVPGVGMATAARLLRRFGDIDALLADTAAIGRMRLRGARRLQGLIERHADTIRLARRLTRIDCAAPLPAGFTTRPRPPDLAGLAALLAGLGFPAAQRAAWRRLAERWGAGLSW